MDPAVAAAPSDVRVVCARCGCLCDDIVVKRSAERVEPSDELACRLGRDWLGSLPPLSQTVLVGGRELASEDGLRVAVDLLARARAPALVGLSGLTLEAQREAVLLAETLRAPLVADPATPHGELRSGLLAPELAASLDEVRASADLVVFWRADPMATHPRHLERYSGCPLSEPLGERAERTVAFVGGARERGVGIDDRVTGGRAVFLDLPADPACAIDVSILVALRRWLEQGGNGAEPVPAPRHAVSELRTLIQDAARVQVFLGCEAAACAPLWDAWSHLGAALHATHRFGLATLAAAGNARGIREVAGWQLGLPLPLDFDARGAPRHLADGLDLDRLLVPGACDLLVTPGLELADIAPAAAEAMAAMTRIHLGPVADPAAAVSFVVPGLDPRLRARVVRADGVVLWLSGVPHAGEPDPGAQILGTLRARVTDARAEQEVA